MFKKLVLAVVMLVMFVVPALSQSKKNDKTVSIFAGSYLFQAYQDLDGSRFYGLRAGYSFVGTAFDRTLVWHLLLKDY